MFYGAHLLEISLLLINISVRNDENMKRMFFNGTPCISVEQPTRKPTVTTLVTRRRHSIDVSSIKPVLIGRSHGELSRYSAPCRVSSSVWRRYGRYIVPCPSVSYIRRRDIITVMSSIVLAAADVHFKTIIDSVRRGCDQSQ